MLFYILFARELLQYFGSIECSLKNIEHVLLRGHNLGIVLGGVSEMRHIEENTEIFLCKTTKWFNLILSIFKCTNCTFVAVRENDTYNLHKYLMTKDFLGKNDFQVNYNGFGLKKTKIDLYSNPMY